MSIVMTGRRFRIALIGGVVLLCAVAVALVSLSALLTRHSAQSFLDDLGKLRLGESTLEDTQKLATKYEAAATEEENAVGDVDPNCSPEYCEFKFFFYNAWMKRLRLAPPTWLRAQVVVRMGRVDYKQVELSSGKGIAFYSAVVMEFLSLPRPFEDKNYHVGRKLSSDIKWRVIINMTPHASAKEREQAYAFNLSCLTRLGGCKDAAELLPTIKWDSR